MTPVWYSSSRYAAHCGSARRCRFIYRDFAKAPSVERLVRAACMSVPTFHRNFKAVTPTSPLRYLKTIRLHTGEEDVQKEPNDDFFKKGTFV